jgi:hypothetical protein
MDRRLKFAAALALVACAAVPLSGCSSTSTSVSSKTEIMKSPDGAPIVLTECTADFSQTTDDKGKSSPHKKYGVKFDNASDKTVKSFDVYLVNRDADGKTLDHDVMTVAGPFNAKTSNMSSVTLDSAYDKVASDLCLPATVTYDDGTTWKSPVL